jgi:glutamate formiminotransferase/formiminotetrahydrofolate cyclodeaminase
VPNFSEGRNRDVLNAIADAIRGVDGASLLDMDPGEATNRTVFTFVGSPAAVEEAAFRAVKRAAELIDMGKHHGAHARMGATDVCPFVPVSGITLEECAQIARRVGERVGRELRIPIYLYEAAATRPERRNLANVRKGEYEGLREKLEDPEWKPDFGPAEFNARSGATAIGAREFLIAYNINLNTRNRRLAHDIALQIREQGRVERDPEGAVVRDPGGDKVRKPGLFQHVKAVGWLIAEYGRAQISINLTNPRTTPMHVVFDTVCGLADERGLRVTGSEIVGLVPLEAMTQAGRHYLAKQGESSGVPEERLVEVAIQSLGLSDITPFVPAEKIVEYRVRAPRRLVSMDLAAFTSELASDSPAPGGGSVAALCGSLAASLASMVAHLTYSKRGFEDRRPEMNGVAEEAHRLRAFFLDAIDRDTQAFEAVMAARRLPKGTDPEVAAREAAIRQANDEAIRVPLEVLLAAQRCLELARAVAERGNPTSLSDAGVAALAALACAEGANYNVLINLADRDGSEFQRDARARADAAVAMVREAAERLRRDVLHRLTKPQG